MRPYVVRQGDYLERIALDLGCDASAIWHHPKNAELKSVRDPNLLLPGDIVWAPDPKKKWLPVTTGTTNRFAASIPKTKVRLLCEGRSGPFVNEACVVHGPSGEREETTDGSGMLVVEVPVFESSFRVSFPARHIEYDVHIGHMDPMDSDSGISKRLHNLGYLELTLYGDGGSGGSEQRMAIAAFQAHSELPITGILDDATKAALLDAHGA